MRCVGGWRGGTFLDDEGSDEELGKSFPVTGPVDGNRKARRQERSLIMKCDHRLRLSQRGEHMRKTYRLSRWRGWDRHIDACAREFAAEFGMAPNLLVANSVTLRRMNLAADRARVGNERGDTPEPLTYVELKGFATADYELLFVEEDEVPENSFALIHAWGQEETEPVAPSRRRRE